MSSKRLLSRSNTSTSMDFSDGGSPSKKPPTNMLAPSKSDKAGTSMYRKIHDVTHTHAKHEVVEKKKPARIGATVSLPPPKCLDDVLRKIQATTDIHQSKHKKKQLNDKLMTNLFLSSIDSEEVASAIQNIEYEPEINSGNVHIAADKYEAKSTARFDKKLGAFVYATAVTISEDDKSDPNHHHHHEPLSKSIKTSTTCYSEQNSYPYKVPKKNPKLNPIKPVEEKSYAHHVHLHDVDPLGIKHDADDAVHHHKAIDFYRKNHNVISTVDGKLYPISDADARKYFGDEAKNLFYEQYRKMNEAKNIIATQSSVTTLVSRPATRETDYSTYSYDSDDSSGYGGATEGYTTGRYTMREEAGDFSTSITPRGDEGNSMSKLGEDFFYELQSQVSMDQIHREIDQEILAYDSFARVYHRKIQPRPRSDSIVSVATAGSNINSSRRGSPHRLASTLDYDNSTLMSQSVGIAGAAGGGGGGGGSHYLYDSSYMTQEVPISPRTKYLSGCLKEGLVPLPNLILRKTMCSALNFAHLGIGDKMGRVLAGCIQDLPLIESINLADNNLTDDSLAPLIAAIINIKTLKELDLSRNKVDGESSDSLAEFVSREDCPIVKLVMQNADVDDGECDRFVQMLANNKQLLELDLSNNLLGTAETLDPGTRTGAEAIAIYITSQQCRLKTLKLAWNSIRMTSATKLARALSINNTLTYLDLNCNGLGWAAGEQIGDSIMENRTLKTLLISGNNLTSTACISICIGIVENLALHSINMNENPIGAAGARMIMQISMSVGNRMTVSAANCNTIATDERCWYHPDKVCSDYQLNLAKPFDRAVAYHLCQVVAAHSTYIFTNVMYEETPGRKAVPLKLINAISTDRENYMDRDQLAVLKGLRLLLAAASNVELGTKLFYEADADNSGRLDKDELKEVLDKIGFTLDEDQLSDILAVFDIDGAGTIDLQEFLSLLKSQHREAAHRIRDLTEYPIMALSTEPKKKYIPPRKGILYCSVVDGFTRKAHFYTMSSLDQKYAYKMAQGIGDVAMVNEAIQNTKIRYNEALQLYKTMFNDSGDKIGTLAKIVPLMMFPNEARQLVSKITKDNRVELARIKMVFGVTHRPVFGAYNGYYYLDLSKELHRACLSKLLEQSQTSNAKRGRASIIAPFKVGDTSQHGNWSAFRNEFYNGRPVCMTTAMFTPIPFTGILEFDFSGGIRASGGELRITDKRLCKVLQNICVLRPDEQDEALDQLREWRDAARVMNNAKNIYMPIWQAPMRHALDVGLACEAFNAHLDERQALIKAGSKQEDIHVNYMGAEGAAEFAEQLEEQKDSLLEMAKKINRSDSGGEGGDGDGGIGAFSESESESSSDGEEDEDEDGKNFDGTNAYDRDENLDHLSQSTASEESSNLELTADEELNRRKMRIKELKHRMHLLLHAKHGVSVHAKAYRFAEIIDETFNNLWILSRHLALIVKLFLKLFGNVGRTPYFGSYAVDIVVCLFSRVVDVHNFEIVLSVLDPVDTGAVYCRLGWLNLFNPMKPEVTMELNMSNYEERMVAKIIVYLSVVEPGINLTYKQFQWKRDMDPIPGWDVTEPWMTEEGLAKNGLFVFTYYSGEGKNKMGCIPDVKLRKALTALTLCDENEIIDEDDIVPDDRVCTAEQHYAENKDVWINYLTVGAEGFKNMRL